MASGAIPNPNVLQYIGTISSNSSSVFTFGNSTQHLCVLSGAYSQHHAMFFVTCDSEGTANISTIYKASGITLTGGTRQITVTRTATGGTATLYDLPIVGAAMQQQS